MAFGLFWLFWILFETVRLGVGGLTWATLTQMTPPPNDVGRPGQCDVRLLPDGALATFVGDADRHAGRHLPGRVRQQGLAGHDTRFVNDILLSAPSIVIGLFVYALVVARFKSFSGWAGVVALALIVIPVVIRTTENMLQLIPPACARRPMRWARPSGR
jgi:phosphate transport system permease protein